MKYNFFSFFLSVFLFIPSFVISFFLFHTLAHANQCEYQSEIDRCVQENKNGSPRAINDFVCITSENREEIIYQVVLDKEFKKIDDEIEKYLDNLESDKSRYFGSEKRGNYVEAVNQVTRLLGVNGVYFDRYKDVCSIDVVKKVQSCQNWAISVFRAQQSFTESECGILVNTKLDLYRQAAFDILVLNKIQVREDAMKNYSIDERKKYDGLLDIMMINLSYIQRILHKWTAKIKDTY